MWGKIAGLLIVVFVIFGMFVPLNSVEQITGNSQDSSVAITYGQTTYNNQNYKDMVDEYFHDKSNINLNNVDETVITAGQVNEISADISAKTYNSNQILSCAMVDLNNQNNLKVDVDKSKITLVTENMYKSALKSAGITKGYVIVTSPTTATGESALAGVMKSYEEATNTTIPEELKDVANKDLYTQSQVVNDTNISADQVTDLMNEVKDEVEQQNTTDTGTIINIITNITQNNNINISDNNINSIADSVASSQAVQSQASEYQQQLTDHINSDDAQTLFGKIWEAVTSIFNYAGGY